MCLMYLLALYIHARLHADRQIDIHKRTNIHTNIHSFIRSFVPTYIYICTYYRGLTFPMIEKNRLNIPQETHLQQSNV